MDGRRPFHAACWSAVLVVASYLALLVAGSDSVNERVAELSYKAHVAIKICTHVFLWSKEQLSSDKMERSAHYVRIARYIRITGCVFDF